MIMVGDMFNQGLKYRVDTLCNELAGLLNSEPSLCVADAERVQSQSQSGSGVSLFVAGTGSARQWWPAGLGSPASSGAQNDLRYAFFPGPRRLAIQQGFVTLSNRECEKPPSRVISSDRNGRTPRAHRRGSKGSVGMGGCEVALDVEDVVDGGVG